MSFNTLRCGLPGRLRGRDAPAVDPRDAGTGSRASRTASAPQLRVRALRDLQRLHGHGPLADKRLTKVTKHETKIDWALFLGDIAAHY